jgi:hypothetical protein
MNSNLTKRIERLELSVPETASEGEHHEPAPLLPPEDLKLLRRALQDTESPIDPSLPPELQRGVETMRRMLRGE